MKQAPEEFQIAAATSAILVVAAFALPLVEAFMMGMAEDEVDGMGEETSNANTAILYRRRTALLVLTALTGAGIFASPVFGPLWRYAFEGEKLNSRCELRRRDLYGLSLFFSPSVSVEWVQTRVSDANGSARPKACRLTPSRP